MSVVIETSLALLPPCPMSSPMRSALKRKCDVLEGSSEDKGETSSSEEGPEQPFSRLSVLEVGEVEMRLKKLAPMLRGRPVPLRQPTCCASPSCGSPLLNNTSRSSPIKAASPLASMAALAGINAMKPASPIRAVNATSEGVITAVERSSQKFRVKEYRKTAGSYSDDDDWEAAAKEEYGDNAEVAEWNDIKEDINDNQENAKALAERLGPWNTGLSFIRVDGQKSHDDRSFFIAPHYGDSPDWFRYDANLCGSQLSLGKWKKTKRPILVRVRRRIS